MNYYYKKDQKVDMAHKLMDLGYEVNGYYPDESDPYTDYYSPACWLHGVAIKNGFTVEVDNSNVPKNYQWCITKNDQYFAMGNSLTNIDKIVNEIESVVNDKNSLPMIKVISKKTKAVKKLIEVERNDSLKIGDVITTNAGLPTQIIEFNKFGNYISVLLGTKNGGYKQRKQTSDNLNCWNGKQLNDFYCNKKSDKIYNIEDGEEVTEIIKYKKATRPVKEEVEEEQATETTQEVKNTSNDTTVSFNEEKNGIEIKFNNKPSEEVRTELKSNGFQWSKKQQFWYAKDNEQRREFLINKGYLVIKEENNEQSEEVEITSEPTEIKVIEQVPEVAKESDILNNIETVALNPDNYIYIFAAKDIKDKRSLINRCCITTLKIVNDEQFNYIIANTDKNLFEIEEGKNVLNENEKEYTNSVLVYNKDMHKIRIILNNKVLQFFENRKGSIINLIKPFKLDKKKQIIKTEVKEENNNNCITSESATTTIEQEKIKNNSIEEEIKETVKEVIKPTQKDYGTLINKDIENYNISKELSQRVNNVAFFVNDHNYNEDLKNTLENYKNKSLEIINMTDDISIKEKIFDSLVRFNKKYYESDIKLLNHRANNPSWMVTGRSGLNVRKYNKANDRYNNLLNENVSIIDNFDNKLLSIKQNIKRAKRQAINNQIDNFTKNNNIKIKFEKTKIKIECSKVYNIFDNGTFETIAYKYDNYYIIKNWGYWRIYNKEGNELNTTRKNTTLKAAKEYLTFVINQAA